MNAYEKPKVSDCQNTKVLAYKGKRKSRTLRRDVPIPKYLTYMSGMTLSEIHDIAKKIKNRNYSRYRKVDLIKVIDQRCVTKDRNNFFIIRLGLWVHDITHELLQDYFDKRLFQDSVRAWVGLFVSDESVSEHYAQIILGVLSPMGCFKEKDEETFSRVRLDNKRDILFCKSEYMIATRIGKDSSKSI